MPNHVMNVAEPEEISQEEVENAISAGVMFFG